MGKKVARTLGNSAIVKNKIIRVNVWTSVRAPAGGDVKILCVLGGLCSWFVEYVGLIHGVENRTVHVWLLCATVMG